MLLALAVRVALAAMLWSWPGRAMVNPDAVDHLKIGRNLWLHGAFSSSVREPLLPEFVRAPLYPAFLAVTGGPAATIGAGGERTRAWILVPCFFQVLIGCATVLLTVRISRLLLRLPDPIPLVLGLLGALDLNAAVFCGLLMTETLFTFLWTLGLAAALWTLRTGRLRPGFLFLAAALTGAAFTRPIAEYALPFLLLVLGAIHWRRRGAHGVREVARAAAPALLVLVVACGLWAARNISRGGPVAFTAAGNCNLFVYGRRMESLAAGTRDAEGQTADWRRSQAAIEDSARSPRQLDRNLGREGRRLLWTYRRKTLEQGLAGIERTLPGLAHETMLYLGAADGEIRPLRFSTLADCWRRAPGLTLLRLFWISASVVLLLLAIAGLLPIAARGLTGRIPRKSGNDPGPPADRGAFLIIAAGFLYLEAVGIFNNTARFHLPMAPSMLWILGFALAQLRTDRLRRRRPAPV